MTLSDAQLALLRRLPTGLIFEDDPDRDTSHALYVDKRMERASILHTPPLGEAVNVHDVLLLLCAEYVEVARELPDLFVLTITHRGRTLLDSLEGASA